MTEEQPFAGVRVLELAHWVFVPAAGCLLADWGADVIHVEPLEGDPYRALRSQGIGVDGGAVNLAMEITNRGKRSLALDLKKPHGREVFDRLLAESDVFLTSLRPKALARLGLDAATLRRRFPGLIYARGTGYGVRGPDADLPGYDASAFFARGGLADALTPPDRDYPIHQRGAMGDRNGGMAIAFGIAAALFKKARTGQGSVVDVSLLATAMWTIASDVTTALAGGQIPRPASRADNPNPLTAAYRTADGRFVQLLFLQPDRYWADFCRALGREDLIDDPRFCDMEARRRNAAACVAELDAEFGRRTFAEAKALLSALDVPWAPVQKVEELPDDPQVIANGYVGEVPAEGGRPAYRMPAVPVQFDERPPPMRPAPEFSQHTEAILLECGYDWEEIAALKDEGVIP